jgi:hypothetical protein
MWKSPEDRRASWRAGRPRMAFSLHTESYGRRLQSWCGVATTLGRFDSGAAPFARNRRDTSHPLTAYRVAEEQ